MEVGAADRFRHDAPERRFLVVGRDNHRHPASRAVIDGLRNDGCEVVVVDMGWPSEDRHYADIATFGSSRAVGTALLALLAGR
jgi:beta-N-acetylhexosaminidase